MAFCVRVADREQLARIAYITWCLSRLGASHFRKPTSRAYVPIVTARPTAL